MMRPAMQNKLNHLLSMRSNAALRARYDQITAQGHDALCRGQIYQERFFNNKVPGVSLFVGPGQFSLDLQAALREAQIEIKGAEENVQLAPASQFHIGLFILNPTFNYDMDGAHGEKDIYTGDSVYQEQYYDRYVQVISKVAEGLSPFEVSFQGLCASTGAIFARGYDHGVINQFRADLSSALIEAGLPFADRTTNIVHTTLARFSGPLHDPASFALRAQEMTQTFYGAMSVDKILMIKEETPYLGSYATLAEFRLC